MMCMRGSSRGGRGDGDERCARHLVLEKCGVNQLSCFWSGSESDPMRYCEFHKGAQPSELPVSEICVLKLILWILGDVEVKFLTRVEDRWGGYVSPNMAL